MRPFKFQTLALMLVICSTSLSLIANSAFALNPNKFNDARNILAKAGFDTAGKTHLVHGTAEVPDNYGTNLINEANNELTQKKEQLAQVNKSLNAAINTLTTAQKEANNSKLTPQQKQSKQKAVKEAQKVVDNLTARINTLNKFINNAPTAISSAKNKLT